MTVSQNSPQPSHAARPAREFGGPIAQPPSALESLWDVVFQRVCQAGAVTVLLLAGLLVAVLVWKAWEAIGTLGLEFFTTAEWDPEPTHRKFGALAFIYGTVVTSAIALVVAVPVGVGTAVFLAEIAPRRLRRAGSLLVEMLATIPSVVYGFWGLFVLAPLFQDAINLLGGPNQGGVGLVPAGLILSIMIVPYVAAVSFEVCRAVPRAQREASYAMGSTRWQTIWSVILPYSRRGIIGGCFLALGRALGETMAVTMLIGNTTGIELSPFAMGNSIPSVIANEFTEATYDLYLSALVELGLVLLLVTVVINSLARLMLWQIAHAGPASARPGPIGWRERLARAVSIPVRLLLFLLLAWVVRQAAADTLDMNTDWPTDSALVNTTLLGLALLGGWWGLRFLYRHVPRPSPGIRNALLRGLGIVLLATLILPPLALILLLFKERLLGAVAANLAEGDLWQLWGLGWLLGLFCLLGYVCRRPEGANLVATGVLSLLFVVTVGFLLWIFGFLVYEGVGALNLDFFTKLPARVGEPGGGMANAIYGSFLLVTLATLFAVPIGLSAAIYLAEYRSDRLGPAVRFVGELLGGVPSIVIGIFGYYLLVKPLGHFSAWAGAFALGTMMVPIVLRAAEEALRLVPQSTRNASLALGAGTAQTIARVIVPAALPAIVTAIFLAIARIVGETAPLLLTAFNNRLWPRSPNEATPSLPYYIYSYAISPSDEWHRLGWAAALVLLVIVLVLNFGIRLVTGARVSSLGQAD